MDVGRKREIEKDFDKDDSLVLRYCYFRRTLGLLKTWLRQRMWTLSQFLWLVESLSGVV